MTKQSKMFLFLTFLITWGCWWILSALTTCNILQYGEIPFLILYVIGGNGPFISAFLVKRIWSDKEQYKLFIKQILKIQNNLGWYVWIIIIVNMLSGISWIIKIIGTGYMEPLFGKPVYMALLMLPLMVIGGGLEEVGWRGVLLPDMLNKLPKFLCAVVIGAIWALWHLPLWFIKGVPQENSSYLFFIISVLGLSLLLTLLFDKTRSIFMCILFHSFKNSYDYVLNSPGVNPYLSSFAKLIFCIIIFVLFEVIWHKSSNAKTKYQFPIG